MCNIGDLGKLLVGFALASLTVVLAGLLLFEQSGPKAYASAGASEGESKVTGSSASQVTRLKIPRLKLGVGGSISGSENNRAILISVFSKTRFEFNSSAQLYAIERYYRPRKVSVRFKGQTYRRLTKLGTILPEMGWGFLRPGVPPCKVGSRPKATVKFQNRSGRYTRTIQVACKS